MKIASQLTQLIGNTPLLELCRIEKEQKLKAKLIVKLESFNPLSSAKDRIAMEMIEDAEKRGVLKPGSVIVEPTSGNTGIGLSFVAAVKGYRIIITMPETMSMERRRLMSALGAELVLTEGAKGMTGAIEKAESLAKEIPNAFLAGQFTNPANIQAHKKTTAQEIWKDTEGHVDIFLAGVGTGGTVSGVGRALKEKKPEVKIIAVEPADSPVLSGGAPGAHKIQGIGAGFIPEIMDLSVVDEIMTVTNEQAFEASRMIAKKEGVLAGISSGAALSAAITLAKQPENEGKYIVALLPDTGERYLSTELYE